MFRCIRKLLVLYRREWRRLSNESFEDWAARQW